MNRIVVFLLVLIVGAGAFFLLQDDPEENSGESGGNQTQTQEESQTGGDSDQQPETFTPTSPETVQGNEDGREQIGNTNASQADPSQQIEVVVLNQQGRALADAVVAAMPKEPFDEFGVEVQRVKDQGRPVDRNGRITFSDLDLSVSYRVAAVAPGFGVKRTGIVEFGQTVTLELEPTVVVPGKVVRMDESGVADAHLMLVPKAMTLDGMPPVSRTGPNGQFSMEAPSQGAYMLRVRSSAGDDQNLEIDVRRDMEPLVVTVSGDPGLVVQLRNVNGEVLKGVKVEVRRMGRGDGVLGPRTSDTNESGEAFFYSLQGGVWEVVVEHEEYATLKERWINRGPERLERILQEPGILEVGVFDESGAAMRDFLIYLEPEDPKLRQTLAPEDRRRATNDEGSVLWESLLPGNYLVSAGQARMDGDGAGGEAAVSEQALPDRSAQVWATVQSNETEVGELILYDFISQRIRVLQNGFALEGADVVFSLNRRRSGEEGSPFHATVTTDAAGETTLPPAREGKQGILIRANELSLPFSSMVEVANDNQVREIEIPSGQVYGHLSHEGDPVAGARVRLTRTNGQPLIDSFSSTGRYLGVLSDDEGNWVIENVLRGEYLILVEAADLFPHRSAPLEHDGMQSIDLGEIELEASATLNGIVRNLPKATGAFNLVSLILLDTNGQRAGATVVDSEGRYKFPNLSPGRYQLSITLDSGNQSSEFLDVNAGANTFHFSLNK